jgi:hypothetical protein
VAAKVDGHDPMPGFEVVVLWLEVGSVAGPAVHEHEGRLALAFIDVRQSHPIAL